MSTTDATALLSVRDLSVAFADRRGETRPLREVSFDVQAGQRLALVGESGSGKSLTALAIMGLIRSPGRIAGGEILLEGRDLLALRAREMAAVRGGEIAMIYQNPLSALNPVQTIAHQLVEAIRRHRSVGKDAARRVATDLLGEAGVPDPARRIDSYPHQFSGGMLQRVVIAMALAADPKLLIADEPTTALDVTTQARIVDLLQRIVSDRGAAIIFITHDLGVAAALCEDIQVMYAGRIVERAEARRFYDDPVHPYSEALLGAVCRLDAEPDRRLTAIPGSPPLAGAVASGCAFHPRCPHAIAVCSTTAPPRVATGGPGWFAECHLAELRQAGAPDAGTRETSR